jgi:hypothetical protein
MACLFDQHDVMNHRFPPLKCPPSVETTSLRMLVHEQDSDELVSFSCQLHGMRTARWIPVASY